MTNLQTPQSVYFKKLQEEISDAIARVHGDPYKKIFGHVKRAAAVTLEFLMKADF